MSSAKPTPLAPLSRSAGPTPPKSTSPKKRARRTTGQAGDDVPAQNPDATNTGLQVSLSSTPRIARQPPSGLFIRSSPKTPTPSSSNRLDLNWRDALNTRTPTVPRSPRVVVAPGRIADLPSSALLVPRPNVVSEGPGNVPDSTLETSSIVSGILKALGELQHRFDGQECELATKDNEIATLRAERDELRNKFDLLDNTEASTLLKKLTEAQSDLAKANDFIDDMDTAYSRWRMGREEMDQFKVQAAQVEAQRDALQREWDALATSLGAGLDKLRLGSGLEAKSSPDVDLSEAKAQWETTAASAAAQTNIRAKDCEQHTTSGKAAAVTADKADKAKTCNTVAPTPSTAASATTIDAPVGGVEPVTVQPDAVENGQTLLGELFEYIAERAPAQRLVPISALRPVQTRNSLPSDRLLNNTELVAGLAYNAHNRTAWDGTSFSVAVTANPTIHWSHARNGWVEDPLRQLLESTSGLGRLHIFIPSADATAIQDDEDYDLVYIGEYELCSLDGQHAQGIVPTDIPAVILYHAMNLGTSNHNGAADKEAYGRANEVYADGIPLVNIYGLRFVAFNPEFNAYLENRFARGEHCIDAGRDVSSESARLAQSSAPSAIVTQECGAPWNGWMQATQDANTAVSGPSSSREYAGPSVNQQLASILDELADGSLGHDGDVTGDEDNGEEHGGEDADDGDYDDDGSEEYDDEHAEDRDVGDESDESEYVF